MAADYKHQQDGGVLHAPTGMSIPADPANRHWRAFEAWQQAGGVPVPAPPTPEALQDQPFKRIRTDIPATLDRIPFERSYLWTS